MAAGFDMTVMQRRQREKLERRNAIIDAAEEIFFTHGFEHATMLQIAQQAELSKGTLYLYFENKDELCHAIILRSLEKIRIRFEKILKLNTSSLDKILELAEVYIRFSQEQPDYYRALQKFRNQMHGQDKTAEYYQKCLLENRKIIALIQEIVETGKQDGSIRKDIDTTLFAELIWDNRTGVLPAIKLDPVETEKYLDDKQNNASEVRYLFELFKTALKN